jgi:hypothetical protein
MGKCSNAFFSETTNMIKAKLLMHSLGSISAIASFLGSLDSIVQVVSEKKGFETFFP